MVEVASSNRRRDLKLAAVVLAIAVTGQLLLLSARRTTSVVSGDEGTFLAMAESLALDGDLVFGPADLQRLEAAPQPGRKTVILQEFGEETAYSKPVGYALLAAPWYRLGGVGGLIALNVVALALSLLLAWAALTRVGASNPAATVATFAGAGVLFSYAAWTMSDSLQASLTLAGLVLGLGGARARAKVGGGGHSLIGRLESFWTGVLDRPWAPYLGVVLLALVVSMRLPNLALAAAPIGVWLLRGSLRRALLLAVTLGLVVGGCWLLNRQLAGAGNPYKTIRATFNVKSGYPVGPGASSAREQFSDKVALATQRVGLLPIWDSKVTLHSTLYFLVGRHTGLLFYFPLAIVLLLAGLRRPDLTSMVVLVSVAMMVVFYLVWLPRNYFGGAGFLGNRYFLTTYMALLVVPRRLPSTRSLAVGWVVAVVVFVSACASILRTREDGPSSQSHAYAGVFRLLPYESTARAIEGRRDRYWSDEFVRFVDPYAEVGDLEFSLEAGSPAAEILIGTRREAGVLRFLVRSDDPEAELVYTDRAERMVFPLRSYRRGSASFVEIVPAAEARRHSFWLDVTKELDARIFRLQLVASQGTSATLSYVGPYRLVPRFYSAQLLELDMPIQGRAGGTTRIPIRLRNRGRRYWQTEDEIPTFLSYRMYRLPEREGQKPYLGPLTALEQRVPPRTEVAAELRTEWPKRPGRYRILVDPVIAGWEWFGSWNGEPVFDGEIEILADTDAESGPG